LAGKHQAQIDRHERVLSDASDHIDPDFFTA